MNAHDILSSASNLIVERGTGYDQSQERSMSRIVAAFNAITGHNLTPEDGWLFMVQLKCVRAHTGAFKADNYEDGAAYFGLMGEEASQSKK